MCEDVLFYYMFISIFESSSRGQSELLSPVVRDDEVTVAARRRRKKVACILQLGVCVCVCIVETYLIR